MSNTGSSFIIASRNGDPKKPIYIRRSGTLSCAEHALIPVMPGDLVVKASHHRRDFTIFVYEIVSFQKGQPGANGEIWEPETTFASAIRINRFSNGEWDEELPEKYQAAIDAAIEKATCYHCRSPHFVKEGE